MTSTTISTLSTTTSPRTTKTIKRPSRRPPKPPVATDTVNIETTTEVIQTTTDNDRAMTTSEYTDIYLKKPTDFETHSLIYIAGGACSIAVTLISLLMTIFKIIWHLTREERCKCCLCTVCRKSKKKRRGSPEPLRQRRNTDTSRARKSLYYDEIMDRRCDTVVRLSREDELNEEAESETFFQDVETVTPKFW